MTAKKSEKEATPDAVKQTVSGSSVRVREDKDEAISIKGDVITIRLGDLSALAPNVRDARLSGLAKTLDLFRGSPERIIAALDPAAAREYEPVPQRNRNERANAGELVTGTLNDDLPVLT